MRRTVAIMGDTSRAQGRATMQRTNVMCRHAALTLRRMPSTPTATQPELSFSKPAAVREQLGAKVCTNG